jgi:hypothetical protein
MSLRSFRSVMGTYVRGSIDRFVLGSTAEGILRHSYGPALTVGPNVDVLHAGALKIHRILYATDCSAEAAHGARVAVALAEAFAARIDVLKDWQESCICSCEVEADRADAECCGCAWTCSRELSGKRSP